MVASDNGKSPNDDKALVLVEIIDVNDNPPLFTTPMYSFKVEENIEGEVELGRVEAHDNDGEPHNYFMFSIVECDGVKFEKNGKVSVKYVPKNTFAYSSYDEEASGSENDFKNDRNHFKYKRSYVGKKDLNMQTSLSASSSSSFHNEQKLRKTKQLQYDNPFMSHPNTHNTAHEPFFYIDPHNGAFKSIKPLDRETWFEHRVVIKVTDTHNSSLSSTALVLVTVEDVNDNAPVFVQPSTAYATIVKQEPLLNGDVLATLSASDADEAENGEITYLIVSVYEKTARKYGLQLSEKMNSSNENEEVQIRQSLNSFSINPKTGRLVSNIHMHVNKSMPADSTIRNRSLVIEVMVMDSGKLNRLNSTVKLKLMIVKHSATYYANPWFSLTEQSLAWTLVTFLSTFLVVLVLLTAISLLVCQRKAVSKSSSELVHSTVVKNIEPPPESVFHCWKSVFNGTSKSN